MSYFVDTDSIIINNPDFSLLQTLECGQCFRFYTLSENEYLIIAKGKLLRAKQEAGKVIFYCTENDFLNTWSDYFDLHRDYSEIKNELSKKDEYLSTATREKYGVRLLKQDPWEMLISFIISQNKQIPHIKKIIESISLKYGDYIITINDTKYYSFPNVNKLAKATDEELRALKVGFRAPYLLDAIYKVFSGSINLEIIGSLSYIEAKENLMSIKGVGEKVADCVLLFGYGRYEAFPTDVWVKRVMQHYYFNKEVKNEEIRAFAQEYFGEYSGFAQQYLFYHARDNKIGK